MYNLSSVYEDGKVWLVGYHTSTDYEANEIEVVDLTFTCRRTARAWMKENRKKFLKLVLLTEHGSYLRKEK